MNPSADNRIQSLANLLRPSPAAEWEAQLQQLCPDDVELRRLVLAELRQASFAPNYRPEVTDTAHSPTQTSGWTAAAPPALSSEPMGQRLEQDALLGARIGPYRLVRVLGRGGMGVVYEAEHAVSRQVVALKLVRPGLAGPAVLRRFEFELQTLARLEHPGIARIYHADTADVGGGPQPYFAMELVRGQNLLEYASQRQLGVRARLGLAAEIADAVHYAHQRGVIHRDLKPGNILVTAEGQPKILDFGVARATDGDLQSTTLQTGLGQLVGTLPYMSPEQAGGDPAQIDTRSDVYALGVVLYELLTGRLPYVLQERLIHEVLRIIREDEPTRLSSLNRTLRGDVETIVGKALEKKKERRYASAHELAADLRRFLSNQPIEARPTSTWYQLRKFAARNKILMGGVVATFVALLAGGFTSFALYLRAERNALALERESGKWQAALGVMDRALTAVTYGNLPDQARFSDVLAQIERQVGEIEASQPEVAAVALRTLGTTYQMMFRFVDSAQAYAREAENLRETVAGDHPDVLLNQLRQGILAVQLGRIEDARGSVADALAKMRQHRAVSRENLSEAIVGLASIRAAEKDWGEVRRLCEEAIGTARQAGPDAADELAAALLMLGQSEAEAGEHAAAAAAYEQAIPKARMVFGEFSSYTLMGVANLAHVYARIGRGDDAIRLCDELSSSVRKKLADEPIALIDALNSVGVTYFDLRARSSARACLVDALSLAERELGFDDPKTVLIRFNLAQSSDRNGLASREAVVLFGDSVPQMAARDGPDHPSVLFGWLLYGQALVQVATLSAVPEEDLWCRAGEILESAYDRLERLGFPSTHIAAADLSDELSQVYDALGTGTPRAVDVIREALESKPPGSFLAAMNALRLVQTLIRADRLTEAQKEFDRSAGLVQEHLKNPHMRRWNSTTLGCLRLAEGRYPEAEAALLDAEAGMDYQDTRLYQEARTLRGMLARLYATWHAAEPHAGLWAAAEHWAAVATLPIE